MFKNGYFSLHKLLDVTFSILCKVANVIWIRFFPRVVSGSALKPTGSEALFFWHLRGERFDQAVVEHQPGGDHPQVPVQAGDSQRQISGKLSMSRGFCCTSGFFLGISRGFVSFLRSGNCWRSFFLLSQ